MMQRRFPLTKCLGMLKTQKLSTAQIRGMSGETYSEKQAKKGRPVSPHVTIYKFPLVALSSITNRVTGVILSGGKYLIFVHDLF